jgi:hypothetical protein
MTKLVVTDEDRQEAARLKALGYRRTSNRYGMLSRIDRPDWLTVLAIHMRRSPATFYVPGQDHPEGSWCDHYRRVLSKDKIEVSQAISRLVPSSDHDPIGYIGSEEERAEPLTALYGLPPEVLREAVTTIIIEANLTQRINGMEWKVDGFRQLADALHSLAKTKEAS